MSFILPDFLSHCTFPLSCHPDADEVSSDSVEWIRSHCTKFTDNELQALQGLQAAILVAYCHPKASRQRLRVASDFSNFLFHLDNISDGMMTRETHALANVVMNALWFNDKYRPTSHGGVHQPPIEVPAGKIARDFWSRFLTGSHSGTQARFKEYLGQYFEAVDAEARLRADRVIPDLESYINIRRDTSGCKPSWPIIEYAMNIELPDYVVDHPVMEALNRATNDFVTWSNDIFSYKVEHARGDTHNMVIILMKNYNHTLQSAVDYVAEMCMRTMDEFSCNRKLLPSWGADIDNMVKQYVDCLQNWFVGSVHWSFETHRYFGPEGAIVKQCGVVYTDHGDCDNEI